MTLCCVVSKTIAYSLFVWIILVHDSISFSQNDKPNDRSSGCQWFDIKLYPRASATACEVASLLYMIQWLSLNYHLHKLIKQCNCCIITSIISYLAKKKRIIYSIFDRPENNNKRQTVNFQNYQRLKNCYLPSHPNPPSILQLAKCLYKRWTKYFGWHRQK